MTTASVLRQAFCKAPDSLRPLLAPLPAAWRFTQRSLPPVYLWRGRSRQAGLPLCVAWAGPATWHRQQYPGLMFKGPPDISCAGRFFFWQVTGAIRRQYPDCALIIWAPGTAARRVVTGEPHFAVPRWIRMEIDISPPMKTLKKISRSGYRNISRLITKHGYSLVRATDPAAHACFYEHMYLPFIKKRFGDGAFAMRREDVFDPSDAPELYQLCAGGRAVAGAVVKHTDGCARISFFGVRKDCIDLIHRGILGACYYFIIQELQARGHTRVGTGDCSPFVNDGVTRFKIRLLARLAKIQPFDYTDCAHLVLLRPTGGLRDFLLRNPFMYCSGQGGLRGAVWADGQDSIAQVDFQKACSRMNRAGIEKCDIFTFQPLRLPPRLTAPMTVGVHNAHSCFLHP